MDTVVWAALLPLAVGVTAVLASAHVSPSLGRLAFAAVVILAVAACTLAFGWAARW